MSPSPLLTCYCDASTEKRLILTSSAFVAEIETSKKGWNKYWKVVEMLNV